MNETQTIRCLIVDDEPPAREIIRRYVQEIPTLQLMGECANAIQVLTILQQQPIDLLFLDIRMPQLNGTDFIKTLQHPPKVIFTTAFSEYALEGYELDVVDYLMKPIRFDRFLKAVNKAFPLNNAAPVLKTVAPLVPEEKKNESFVYFRADRKMVKVMLDDIFYIESMKDYIKVHTVQGVIITKQSISSVEAMLPAKLFVRTHRSFIVSINKIKSFTNELVEIDKTDIPIGKLFRNGVLKVFTP
ncbi:MULTISPECIES: LytR/AlgR family response regulator transcription factor [Niastella]|uniref:Response regulator transcription factor n=1 Tax=Niastella soli TaxID=2821487 RepID=A0ABS3YP61_9BACT|nr:response regulator transcription factor [Niastella soli]MBO9199669.1 response regulator transcription factor [Niastella soli]